MPFQKICRPHYLLSGRKTGNHLHYLTSTYNWEGYFGRGPTKQLPTMFCSTFHLTVLRATQCNVRFLNHFAHAQLPWTSISCHPVKVATIAKIRSFLHFLTLSTEPLFDVIHQALWVLDTSEVSRSCFMLHPGKQICEHLARQLNSGISIVSEVCIERSSAWKCPVSAGLL